MLADLTVGWLQPSSAITAVNAATIPPTAPVVLETALPEAELPWVTVIAPSRAVHVVPAFD